MSDIIHEDAWQQLRAFTHARIALGRTGTAVPLQEQLSFRMAHALARDAVHTPLQTTLLMDTLVPLQLPLLRLQSQAGSREEYLQRPDLGRKLSGTSVALLQQQASESTDIALMIGDGLSAVAVQLHAAVLLNTLVPMLRNSGFGLSPLTVIEQARVGISDETAFLLKARMALLLIGERPGLSSADSLGVYMTYNPRPRLTDEARNCISNIRPAGLPPAEAAHKIHYLVQQAFIRQLSGIQLKDNYPSARLPER